MADQTAQGNDRQSRHLAWDGCYNVRDLGGLPTIDGTGTRRGAVIRADLLGRLTTQGRRDLLEYGVRTVIDLRAPAEVQKEHSAFTEEDNGRFPITYHNLPLEKFYPHVGALIKAASSRAEVYCIVLDHYPDAVANVMRTIGTAVPGGVVIHCHAGKDRTGIISGLLLRLAGVPPKLVAADYAVSQERLAPLYAKSRLPDEPVDFWDRPTATADMMFTMLEHVKGRYGSVQNYLRDSGLAEEDMARLRTRLRE